MRAGAVMLLTCLVVWPGPAEARRGDRLQTGAGVLMLGGRLAVDIDHINPDQGKSQSGAELDFSPIFGGFPIRNLLLHGGLSVKKGFGDLHDKDPTTFGFRFGLQYLFNYGSIVVPYLGFAFGPSFLIPEQGDTGTALSVGFPAGILISLNEHVAVNVGTEVDLTIGVTDPQATLVHVPMGYVGINAYF